MNVKPDSENMDVAPDIQPKHRYNTRTASRQALADISNTASSSNLGDGPNNNLSNVPVVANEHVGDTARPAATKDAVEEVKALQVAPGRPILEHVLADPVAAQAYESSLKLPLHVVDIDSQDRLAHNHLAESTLAMAIHRSQMDRELGSMPKPDYLRQSNLSPRIRTILVDWLVDVHAQFKLAHPALFLAVNIVDRFLATEDTVVSRSQVQLVGVACMWIAAKYEQIYPPSLGDFVYISANTYTSDEVLRMEALVCNKLNFVFTVPTPLQFATRGIKAFHTMHPNADERITEFTHYALELALCDYGMIKYRPSMVAASAVALAVIKLVCHNISWDATMCYHTGRYTIDDLCECGRDLWRLIQRDCDESRRKISAVRRKYSTDEFKHVALIIPTFNSEQLCSNPQDAMDIDH